MDAKAAATVVGGGADLAVDKTGIRRSAQTALGAAHGDAAILAIERLATLAVVATKLTTGFAIGVRTRPLTGIFVVKAGKDPSHCATRGTVVIVAAFCTVGGVHAGEGAAVSVASANITHHATTAEKLTTFVIGRFPCGHSACLGTAGWVGGAILPNDKTRLWIRACIIEGLAYGYAASLRLALSGAAVSVGETHLARNAT